MRMMLWAVLLTTCGLLVRAEEPSGPLATVQKFFDAIAARDMTAIMRCFSHCGFDNFDLVKIEGKWKIAGVTFTVEKQGCPASPLGPPRQG